MEDYNWDDWDSQASEYLNSQDYAGPEFSTPDDMSWGGQGANQSDWTGSNWQGPQEDYSGMYNSGIYGGSQLPGSQWSEQQLNNPGMNNNMFGDIKWGDMWGKGADLLNQAFKAFAPTGQGNQNQSGVNSALKAAMSLWAAQQEKKNQQEYAGRNQDTIRQQQQQYDPFAGQRERYMQELLDQMYRINQFRADPDANAQYATMRQDVINQANRYSRRWGTSDVQMAAALAPQLVGAQQKIEDQMQGAFKNLFTPSGANINPYTGGLQALLANNKDAVLGNSNASYANALMKLFTEGTSPTSGLTQDQLIKLMRG